MHDTIYLERWQQDVSVHWQQGKFQVWANCFMCWIALWNIGPHCTDPSRSPTNVTKVRATLPITVCQKGIGTGCVVSHTHLAVYTWQWRIDIIFLYHGIKISGNMTSQGVPCGEFRFVKTLNYLTRNREIYQQYTHMQNCPHHDVRLLVKDYSSNIYKCTLDIIDIFQKLTSIVLPRKFNSCIFFKVKCSMI